MSHSQTQVCHIPRVLRHGSTSLVPWSRSDCCAFLTFLGSPSLQTSSQHLSHVHHRAIEPFHARHSGLLMPRALFYNSRLSTRFTVLSRRWCR